MINQSLLLTWLYSKCVDSKAPYEDHQDPSTRVLHRNPEHRLPLEDEVSHFCTDPRLHQSFVEIDQRNILFVLMSRSHRFAEDLNFFLKIIFVVTLQKRCCVYFDSIFILDSL